MGKSHILMRKVNQVKPDNYEEILQINAPNGGLSGEVQTIAITHVLKKDAEMLIQVDGGGVEGGLLCSSLREYDSSDLSLGISFEEELVITGKNIAKSPGSFTQFWVIYSVDKGTLLPKRSETTKRHGVEYEKKWFKTKDGVEYSVEVPRALETVSRTIADEDTVFKERDEGRITGRVKAYLRRQVTEDGGHDLPWYYNTSQPADVYQFDDQEQDWELEPTDIEEKPELSVTLPGSSRSILTDDQINLEDEGVETDEDEGTESQIFSFEFNFYDTKIPNYQGPLELKATFEEAENIPAIIHLV